MEDHAAPTIGPFWTDRTEGGPSMLHLVATSANDGIWGWDVPTGRSFYSPRWWQLIGHADGAVEAHIGVFTDLLHPEDRDRVMRLSESFISGEEGDYRVEFRLRHRDGGYRWILSRGSAQRDAGGRAYRIAGTHTDIHDRMETADRLEQLVIERTAALRSARDRAELAAATTAKFLAATSHDVRQPLQAMALLLGGLQSEVLTETGQRTLDGLRRSLVTSMELLDDLLEFSRLDAGVLRPHLGPVDLNAVFESVADGYLLDARRRGLFLRVRQTKLTGYSDAQLLGRIVRNLVSNALKFTTSGGVLVACRKSHGAIRIEIWDTGRGIRKNMQREIFGEFVQDRSAQAPDRVGLGLGLSIVDRLCKLLEHQIGVRSELGRGSRFSVTIPVFKSERPVRARPAPSARLRAMPAACRVAVIENDPEVAEAFRALLTDWGCDCVLADSAEEMITKLGSRRPDLVIADWHIEGGFDGFQALDLLDQAFGRELPSVVLTGDYDLEALAAANRAGRRVLHKPILPHVLNAVMYGELTKSAARLS